VLRNNSAVQEDLYALIQYYHYKSVSLKPTNRVFLLMNMVTSIDARIQSIAFK